MTAARSLLAAMLYRLTVERCCMKTIYTFDLLSFADTLISLLTAFIMGTAIGLERQFRQRTAGLRTNVLVALGAAIFVDMAFKIAGAEGAARVVAYVVSGVGFLGAGVIMREEGHVRGINTAATLWGSAAIGACAGAGMITEAFMGTLFVLAANTLLRPAVNYINRQPIDSQSVEFTHVIHISALIEKRQEAIKALKNILSIEKLPLSELDITNINATTIDIEAMLMATSVLDRDLDRAVKKLCASPHIQSAFHATSTTE